MIGNLLQILAVHSDYGLLVMPAVLQHFNKISLIISDNGLHLDLYVSVTTGR